VTKRLLKKVPDPFAGGYKPELDDSPGLDPIKYNFFQSQIWILRWCVDLGCIGIITEISIMSTHLYLMREDHSDAVFHVFADLAPHHNYRALFTLITPLLTWLHSSRLTGSPCMAMLRRLFLLMIMFPMGRILTCACKYLR
jgi:hypothetical protein